MRLGCIRAPIGNVAPGVSDDHVTEWSRWWPYTGWPRKK